MGPLAGADPVTSAARLVARHRDDPHWLDRFVAEIDRHRSSGELVRVLEVWGLSRAELARILGVSRQAVSKWVAVGVPAERATALADLAAATDLLVRYLRRDRIPAVVRRPAPRFGGYSLVQLAADDTRTALEACRAMFDFASVHA
jgi:DNA-binding transcriptional regulator YdaS (Cro superfamily)